MKFFPSRFQWSILLGNVFEHYDTALYGLLAPFFAHHFFPTEDPLTSLILTYTLLPIGIFIRPLGTLFFGMIGDMYGGRRAFTVSLLGVALITILMALLPTYNQVGFWSPVLLTLARTAQSFFAAGEVSSGGVLLMQNTPEENKNIMSGYYNNSTMGGILLASAAVSLSGYFSNLEYGWRLLYLLGSFTLLIVYVLRKNLSDQSHKKERVHLKELCSNLWTQKKLIFAITIVSGFSYSCFSVAFVLINGLLPHVTNLTKIEAVNTNTFFMGIDFLILPVFAWVGNFVSHRTMLLIGSASAALLGIPLFGLLEGATFDQAMIVRFFLMLIGVSFSATILPWSQKLLPPSVRFTGTGMAFAFGAQLIGVPTTALSLWIYQQTELASSAGWYWVFLACVSGGIVLWVHATEPKEAFNVSGCEEPDRLPPAPRSPFPLAKRLFGRA